MINIFVDADGCPVKQEICRVSKRCGLKAYFVSNSWINLPSEDLFELIVVKKDFDAADNWIVEHAGENDIVVSGDIPLASRCLKKGVRVLDSRGRIFTEESIGDDLADRELMAYLRDIGAITGGQHPFDKKDRSLFLQRLDEIIQAATKKKR